MNLSAYTNTIITVEVIGSSCSSGAHKGYMYYDAVCSTGAIIANNTAFVSSIGSYTSCALTATLSGLPGLTNYIWQGPGSSGVSGSTVSAVTTSVSGNYTLTASLGTVITTQTLALMVNAPINPTLSGTSTLCLGQSATLQVTGNGINSYSWSSGSSQQSITISPSLTTIYSVTTTNTLGCSSLVTHTLNLLPVPTLNILSTALSICPGQIINLYASSFGIASYTWNTGVSNFSTSVSPTLTSVYSVTGTTSGGCETSAVKMITVFPSPQLQIGASSITLCSGQSANLIATGMIGNTYLWTTGASSSSITLTPSLSSIFNVTATSTDGCVEIKTITIIINPIPQVQVISSPSAICVGQSANIGVIGTNISNVLWSNGANSSSVNVSPSLISVYSATVFSSLGCPSIQSISLVVNQLPQTQIQSSRDTICAGESAILSIDPTGLSFYIWSVNQTSNSISVSPTISTVYSVTITDLHNCSNTKTYNLLVANCSSSILGLHQRTIGRKSIKISPNPSEGNFEISGFEEGKVVVTNEMGQMVAEGYLKMGNNYIVKISNLSSGVYYVRSRNGSEKVVVK